MAKKATKKSPRLTKKDFYRLFGIEFENDKILSPIGWIPPLLIDGNGKIGKGVWHFSTLPGNKDFSVNVLGNEMIVHGTCHCTCDGCYGMAGNYTRFSDPYNNLAIRTIIAREHIDFCYRAIKAQIQADKIKVIRIHATGDFFSADYLNMWVNIVRDNPQVTFWTYTKETSAESAFDEFQNANIVKSLVPGFGFNFGHIDYIICVYNFLKFFGKSVYICRCGIDKNQHCTNCTACAKCEHVLFIEHSTGYKAEKDPRYNEIVDLINGQDKSFLNA